MQDAHKECSQLYEYINEQLWSANDNEEINALSEANEALGRASECYNRLLAGWQHKAIGQEDIEDGDW